MNLKYIKIVTILTLLVIIVLQTVWLYSMYRSYDSEYKHTVEQALNQAIEVELSMRHLEQSFVYRFVPRNNDSPVIITRKLTVEDTTVYVNINRLDPFSQSRVDQYLFKSYSPIKVEALDSIFHQRLKESRFPAKETYIDYLNLKTKKIIESNRPENKRSNLYASPIKSLDVLDTIGIQAFTDDSHFAVLKKMAFQLALSAILIIFAFLGISRLLYTIVRQRKIEQIRNDFVNTMTHEFRKPISSALFMLGYAEEKLENNQLESVRKYILNSSFELKKLNLYTQKIQEISKGEDGAVEIHKEPLILLPYFGKLKEKYENTEGKIVSVSCSGNQETVLSTDLLHFSNIMENLLENAIKYSGENVQIQLNTSTEGEHISISVRDNGWGIPSSEIPHIFDKFYRGESNLKRQQKGFGLGLSYVKTMVGILGGNIEVNSKENEYTEFTLIFPH